MSATAPIIAFYDYALQPIPALAWVGAPISALDIAGGLRLALILRQIREHLHKEHMAKISLFNTNVRVKNGQLEKVSGSVVPVERRGCVRNFAASLLMVFGGEAVVGALKYAVYGFNLMRSQHRGSVCGPLSYSPAMPPWCIWVPMRWLIRCPLFQSRHCSPSCPCRCSTG
jgi:hypothetical protein